METKIPTIRQLFSAERRFLVPIFQRGYVWTEVGQWHPLWRDVVEQALLVRRAQTARSRAARMVRKHFLGAIVVGADQNSVLQVPTSGVIDGQQRLTTLQILLAALRDAAEPIDRQVHGHLRKLTVNEGDWATEEDQFKLWPTNAYRDHFRQVMTAGSAAALRAAYPQRRERRKLVPEHPRMVACYLYFAGAIDRYLRGADTWDGVPEPGTAPPQRERLLELTEAVQSYLHLVTIELGREDDPQVIFETLNARGVELEPSDLVRNFVFLYAARTDCDPDALYDRYWRPFDEAGAPAGSRTGAPVPGGRPWWREVERQGRIYRERLDLFLFHYVTLRLNREIKIGHLFQEFRDWWEQGDVVIPVDLAQDAGVGTGDLETSLDHIDDEPELPIDGSEPRDVAEELARMRRAADAFRALLAPERETPLGVFASRIKRVDTTTIYPLLLWILEQRSDLTPAELQGVFRDLESYLVRRMVCGLTNKNYNTIFLNLLRKLRRRGRVVPAALRDELTSLTGESSLWPDDARFQQAMSTEPVYSTLGPAKTQLLLEALDAAMEDPRSERIVHSLLTVEHVMPQAAGWSREGEVGYPLPAAAQEAIARAADAVDGGSPESQGAEVAKWAAFRTRMLQTIGNLTLVTQRLNSSLGAQAFTSKRRELTAASRLALNAEFAQLPEDAIWNEQAIARRGARLAAIACRVWPHPGPDAPSPVVLAEGGAIGATPMPGMTLSG